MLIGSLALLGVLLYLSCPGDISGIPYPTTKQEMVDELKEIEALLRDTEREHKEFKEYTRVVIGNAPFSDEAVTALRTYSEVLSRRNSLEYRIKNLKKLISKYEEIDNDSSRESNNKRLSTA